MSDSGRQIGDCKHGKRRSHCFDCLEEDYKAKAALVDELMSLAQGVVNSETSPMGSSYEWGRLVAEARALLAKAERK